MATELGDETFIIAAVVHSTLHEPLPSPKSWPDYKRASTPKHTRDKEMCIWPHILFCQKVRALLPKRSQSAVHFSDANLDSHDF
eukprot:1920802-Amphidinium_carterae.1